MRNMGREIMCVCVGRQSSKVLCLVRQFGSLKSVQDYVRVESIQDFRKGNAKTNKNKALLVI